MGRSIGPLVTSCARSANTVRSSSASFPHASFKNPSRWSDKSSRAEWYSSSIWRKRSGLIATGCSPILLPLAIRPDAVGGPRLHAAVDQLDVVPSELQPTAPHVDIVHDVPTFLHDSACGMQVDPLEDVDDLVRQYVAQKGWNRASADRAQHAVVEQHDVGALERQGIRQRAGMQVLRRGTRD